MDQTHNPPQNPNFWTFETWVLYMSFDKFLLAVESRDLFQADKSIIRVFSFPKSSDGFSELLFLSLNNWGLNFLQNESSQSSQIHLSTEKLRKMFTFQSCKLLNDKTDQNTNCQVSNTFYWYNYKFFHSKIEVLQNCKRRHSYNSLVSLR